MDRLDELAVLAAILDAGSLAGAARRLRRSPPAVTRTLATLEERVGTRLVQRSTRQLTPTEAGRRLATHARQLLADYDQAVDRLKENRQAPIHGLLRVTAPSLFGRMHIAPLVFGFLDTHPGMRVDLVLTNRDLDLIEEGIDVAVRPYWIAITRIAAGPRMTMNSTGRKNRIIGTVSLGGRAAAFFSASDMRMSRFSCAITRSV